MVTKDMSSYCHMSLKDKLTPSAVHRVETCVCVCAWATREGSYTATRIPQTLLRGVGSKPLGTCPRDSGSQDSFSFSVYLTKQVDSWCLEKD